jgi:hypothetical protein
MFKSMILVIFVAAFGLMPANAQEKPAHAVHAFTDSSVGQTTPEVSSEGQETPGSYVEIAGRRQKVTPSSYSHTASLFARRIRSFSRTVGRKRAISFWLLTIRMGPAVRSTGGS